MTNIIATRANKIEIKIVSFISLLYHKKKGKELRRGIEPPTTSLQVRHSTIELPKQKFSGRDSNSN